MKLTIQRKISFGVLGLAALAFVVDRCTSSTTPVAARGAVVLKAVAEHPEPAQHAAVVTSVVANDAETASFALRLQETVAAQGLDADRAADAFHPSTKWIPAPADQADTANRADAERHAAAQKFISQHKLTGVLLAGRNSSAEIDGNTVRLGQSVDSFRLVDLKKDCAIFQTGEGQVELRAPSATSGNLTIRATARPEITISQ